MLGSSKKALLAAWLKRNKIFFEVASYLVMPALALVVAFLQYRIMLLQTSLQRDQFYAQSQPLINVLIKENEKNQSPIAINKPLFQLELFNAGGPAYIDNVEVIGFADLAYGDGTDSTCAYLMPLKSLEINIYDRGSADKILAELTIESLRWNDELEAFERAFSRRERDFIKLYPVYFLQITYSDAQGTTRNANFYLRHGEDIQRIGNALWSRGKEMHKARVKSGFAINASTTRAASQITDVFRKKSTKYQSVLPVDRTAFLRRPS